MMKLTEIEEKMGSSLDVREDVRIASSNAELPVPFETGRGGVEPRWGHARNLSLAIHLASGAIVRIQIGRRVSRTGVPPNASRF